MQTRNPHRRFRSNLRRHAAPLPTLPRSRLLHWHGYQPSIQVVICSAARATYFSTVLVLMPWRFPTSL